MSSSVSVVRPDNDSVAATLAAWGQEIVNDAHASSHSLLHDLRGAQVTRNTVGTALDESDAIFFFGHGTWDTLEGSHTLVDGQNVGRAGNRILIAIACRSARDLGMIAINLGVSAYLGFDEDFAWPIGVPHQVIGSASVAGIKAMLLSGATIATAADTMRTEFEFAVDYFKYGPGSTNANAALGWLTANWAKHHISVKGFDIASLQS